MGIITQRMGDLPAEELQKVTEYAYLLADTFDIDTQESIAGVNALMKQFGISSEEAFNLIAPGAQKGLNQNNDLADQLAEYSVYYADMGFSAEEAMNMLVNGSKDGAYQLDYLNDAIKEFGIRSKDGSKASAEAFEMLGFNAEEMTYKFSQGGDVAKEAFNQIATALKNTEDDFTRNAAGVGLFGTKFEDLGEDAVLALTDMQGAISATNSTLNDMETTRILHFQKRLSEQKKQILTFLLLTLYLSKSLTKINMLIFRSIMENI